MAAKCSAVAHHRRHHSWPPIRLSPSHAYHHTARPAQTIVTIDDNPFAFFISQSGDHDERDTNPYTEDDDETYVSDWMNADNDDVYRTRSLSPFSRVGRRCSSGNGLSAITPIHNYTHAAQLQTVRPPSPRAAIAMLCSWLDRMEKTYFHRQPDEMAIAGNKSSPPLPPVAISPEMLPVPLLPSPPTSSLRGRKRVRRSSKSVGNRAIRSHAGRKRVWREPAEDMCPLSEEEEYAEVIPRMSI